MNYSTRRKPRLNHRQAPNFTNILNELFNSPIMESVERAVTHSRPAVNISKNDKAYILSFALPGLDKKDVAIKVEERQLTVSSDITAEEQKFRLREFNYSKFERVFDLPKDVDVNNISATYEAGILALSLPIAEEAKPKTISVK